jgi:hypothetical protein
MRFAAFLLALALLTGRTFAADSTKTTGPDIRLPVLQAHLNAEMKFKQVKAALKSVALEGEMVGDTGIYMAPIYAGNDSCILIVTTQNDKLFSATFIVVDTSTSALRDSMRNWFQEQLATVPGAEHLVDQDESGIPREVWATEQISWFRQNLRTQSGHRLNTFSFIFRGKDFFGKNNPKKGEDLF